MKKVADKYRFISGFVTVSNAAGFELHRNSFRDVADRKRIMNRFKKRYGPENFENGKYYFTIQIEETE